MMFTPACCESYHHVTVYRTKKEPNGAMKVNSAVRFEEEEKRKDNYRLFQRAQHKEAIKNQKGTLNDIVKHETNTQLACEKPYHTE